MQYKQNNNNKQTKSKLKDLTLKIRFKKLPGDVSGTILSVAISSVSVCVCVLMCDVFTFKVFYIK